MKNKGQVFDIAMLIFTTIFIAIILLAFTFGSIIITSVVSFIKGDLIPELSVGFYSPTGYITGNEDKISWGSLILSTRYLQQPLNDNQKSTFSVGEDILKPKAIYENGEWIFGGEND